MISNLGEVIGVDLISFGADINLDKLGVMLMIHVVMEVAHIYDQSLVIISTDADDDGNVILDSQGNPTQVEVENGIIDVDYY